MPSFNVILPKLSPTMEDGTIAKWHKREGDYVESGELLMEVATDKATVEYNALDSGYLRKIVVPEGKLAKVNDPVAIFTEEKDESIEGEKKAEPEPKQVKAEEGKKETPKKDEPKKEAPKEVTKNEEPKKDEPKKEVAEEKPVPKAEERIIASPLAKKMAANRGIDLTKVKGSGPRGRIMSRDLERVEKAPVKRGEYEEVELSQMRRAIATRLSLAKKTIPHFYVTIEIDALPLFKLREELKVDKIDVTINDLIVKATALSLRKHPNVNTGFNEEKQTLMKFKSIDVSVAVSISEGLITPIVFEADQKSVREIHEIMLDLSKRAREGKLKPEEYQGGSFTVSNLGMYGVKEFQAIINPPQSAILSVSGILDAPVVRDGQVVAGKTIDLSVSSDHRIVDGVAASEFLKTLKSYLENPALLLLPEE